MQPSKEIFFSSNTFTLVEIGRCRNRVHNIIYLPLLYYNNIQADIIASRPGDLDRNDDDDEKSTTVSTRVAWRLREYDESSAAAAAVELTRSPRR